jgi:hypoxanthine phosphoribosyltransferase
MKVDLDFNRISSAIRELPLPQVDLVVGIARGGIVPASLVAYRLGCGLRVLPINYRDDENRPRHARPQVGDTVDIPDGVHSILLVDDVAVSGSTLEEARKMLEPYDVTTMVLKGRADIVVFPDIDTCVNWPWNVRISMNGRTVARPASQPPTHTRTY